MGTVKAFGGGYYIFVAKIILDIAVVFVAVLFCKLQT
jgi:hypothetical protein